jgi:hypothetical protein
VLLNFAEYERLKATLDVLGDPALMKQIEQSRAFYASDRKGQTFGDVFGESLSKPRKTRRR